MGMCSSGPLAPHWFGCFTFQLRYNGAARVDWPTLSSHAGRNTLSVCGVRQTRSGHRWQAESFAPRALLLYKRMTHFSRKEQLLPAPAVLLSRPLCVLIPGQILSVAVPTLSEENRKNSGAQQASAFCYYGYDSIMAGLRFTPALWKRERNVLSPSLLMELKAKGVLVQRGHHQPLNVGSSSSKPHLTIHFPPAVLSKWPPSCACSQRSTTRGGGARPGEIRCLSRCCSSHLLFVFFGLNRGGKV